ncbi:MAG: PD40 domain-containing protein, partial [Vicinamibacteria bacterium]|nr:PD40 domain-containing protein [Vicinamibacteria bacterium]
MPLEPGTRLDAYELVRPLGSGGMGEVWLATELRLGRKVALKFLPAELTLDVGRVGRFEQEARAASALNHPNVSTILAMGETPDGQRYIAMEYVEGETLRRRLAGRLAVRDALDLAIQVASALTAAHAAGIVHRDIKPENVMRRPDGFVKVLDFGLAKLVAPSSTGGAEATRTMVHTDAGTVVGTVTYMSPEQARGTDVDPRTDIWSLGVMLYEMVAGRCPFTGQSSSEVIAAILEREPAPLARFDPDAPPELQRIVGKALRKDREQRYQGMKDLLLDLQALHTELAGAAWSSRAARESADVPMTPAQTPPPGSTVAAPPRPSSAEYVVTQVGRHKVAAILGVCLVIGLTGLAWWTVRNRGADAATTAGPSVAPVQRTLIRLTSGSGLQTDVTWSPDGRFIAYASDKSGNFDIWVQSVGGGDPVQVTRSAAHDVQPDWSPDGNTLVFRSERDGGGLFLVPALGGTERQLTSFGSYPSWSPDASEILFVKGNNLESAESDARLYAVSPEEGAPREILADFFAAGSWSWIASHPDGRITALGRTSQLGPGFFTIARDGTRLVKSKEAADFPLRVVAGEFLVRRRFRWHPSGTALYVQTESDGIYNLWKVRVDPTTLMWLSAERLTTGAGPDVAAALSRDGTRLAFTTEHGSTRLWAFPLDQGARRLGTGRPVTEDDALATGGALSPDGHFVAYNLQRAGIDREELWITNIVNGTSELIAPHADNPCWSPDGKAIAYTYFRRDQTRMLGRVAVRQLSGQERFLGGWRKDLFMQCSWSAERGLVGTYGDGADGYVLALWPTTNPDADKPERVLISKPKTSF